VVLRIEDLDVSRVQPGAALTTIRDLEWLGLDWDGPIELQSAGLSYISDAISQLLERGLAYACVCSRKDVRSALSAPQQGETELRYPGTCRGRFASLAEAERVSGRSAGIRFRVADEDIELVDQFSGPHRSNVQHQVGDFLIARRDKAPAYQLAVVVDDARQGVSEVVRGDDLLASTPRQWLLQRALGLPHPATWHVPLVLDEHGERLAKRRGDLGLAELRQGGTDPRAIVAWAAKTAGQDSADRSTAQELTPGFDPARIPRNPVRLTRLSLETLAAVRAQR
jgi:glutamyl-tRNA synthetase